MVSRSNWSVKIGCFFFVFARMCAYVACTCRICGLQPARISSTFASQIEWRKMNWKVLIGLAAGAAGLLYYKKQLDAEYEAASKRFDEERQQYLDEIAAREEIINPNGTATQPPVSIIGSVTMGGYTLNQLQIDLDIKNYGSYDVELGDWRSVLTVGDIESSRVFPSNLIKVVIPAGKTKTIRFYARGDQAFPGIYDHVIRGLGIDKLQKGLHIEAKDVPASLDIEVLWYWKGGKEEARFYDVPCSFDWPYAAWVPGRKEGYNAGREKQQKMNPSYWTENK